MEPIATRASLERARDHQQVIRRMLRVLGAVLVTAVALGTIRSQPAPGAHGRHLVVAVALVCVAAGVVGVMRMGWPEPVRLGFFVILVASSSTLAWLQPHGPGFLGVFVAVVAAVMSTRGWRAAVAAAIGLVSLSVAYAVTTRSLGSVVTTGLGVAAFALIALLARRLGEGQEQAQRLVVELERAHEGQAQAAALAERQRLAREIHDVLAHSLSGLALQLEGVRLLADETSAAPELRAQLERASELARSGLDNARRAIGALRDEELPGPERLPALVESFRDTAGTPCRLEVSGASRTLPSEARLTVYRVAQEALTNISRHALPERVELHLAYEPNGTRLRVEDFGGPPPQPHRNGGGHGLTGMRERAELLGGDLTAGPTANGFRVDLWVPG